MKFLKIFLLIVLYSATAFGQQYIIDEQDVGFDVVQVIAERANMWRAPTYSSMVVTTFSKTARLTLLDRKPTYGDWYSVSDIMSLKRGWIHKSDIEIYYTNKKLPECPVPETIAPPKPRTAPQQTTPVATGDSPFTAQYVGGDVIPTVLVNNTTNRQLTIVLGNSKYDISPSSKQTFQVPPGNYSYQASVPRARAITGNVVLQRGYEYTWNFRIVTVRVR
jgi:hypothetical protein